MSVDPQLPRRTVLEMLAAAPVAGSMSFGAARAVSAGTIAQAADVPRALKDRRREPLKDLDGYFPFEPIEDAGAWERRAERVRRQILVASGLWPMPDRPKIEAVVHSPVDRGDYTVSRVFFESSPGLYVTGSLYRPAGEAPAHGRPGIACPHGHWREGRFHRYTDDEIKKELESGGEKFEQGGRAPVQARCVQLARMGCVVFLYDMIGYADSAPLTYELAHRFNKQRPELSSPERWGMFSAQSELRSLNILGLQLWNSIRVVDWLSTLPDVDPTRIAVTGSSGGGTQTMLLAAVDPRVMASFPAVMVSTSMQGGCTCENASHLRVGTGNIEFAALCAPRPQAMTGANDWTREIETKGLPQLKRQYEVSGAPGKVNAKYFNFGHNYNHPSRRMMYDFMKDALGLPGDTSIDERDFQPLTVEEATVWTAGHTKPALDEPAEVSLLRSLAAASDHQLEALTPSDAGSLAEYQRVVGGGLDVLIGRTLPAAGEVVGEMTKETDRGSYLDYDGILRLDSQGEEVPVAFLYPKKWNKKVILWADPRGKAALRAEGGAPTDIASALLEAGFALGAVDVFGTGAAAIEGATLDPQPKVKNEREFAGFTFGYNHSLIAKRVHDLLTLIAFARHHEEAPEKVVLIGAPGAGTLAALAAAVAGPALNGTALDTRGYRFANITEYLDPNLIPGAVKYGDLPGFLALVAPTPLFITGEGPQSPQVIAEAFKAAGAEDKLTIVADHSEVLASLQDWLGKI